MTRTVEKSTTRRASVSSAVALALALVLMIASALWVPINLAWAGPAKLYYEASLFDGMAPRALMGTVSRLLGLDRVGFIALLQVSQLAWMTLLLRGLLVGADAAAASMGGLLTVGFLLSFNTVVYVNNALGGLLDPTAYLCTLSSVVLLSGRPSRGRTAGAAVLGVLAVMVHEKSVFDLAIVAVWLSWKRGFRGSLPYLVATSSGCGLFLASAWDVGTGGEAFGQYASSLAGVGRYLRTRSLNVYGIGLAGGIGWVLLGIAAFEFVKAGKGRRDRAIRTVVSALMVMGCFLPLTVAHDTNRLVGLIWLPTFLLVRETDVLKTLVGTPGRRVGAVLACALQLLIPPVLIWTHHVTPLNHYAALVLERLHVPESRAHVVLAPCQLYSIERPDITVGTDQWRFRLFRQRTDL